VGGVLSRSMGPPIFYFARRRLPQDEGRCGDIMQEVLGGRS